MSSPSSKTNLGTKSRSSAKPFSGLRFIALPATEIIPTVAGKFVIDFGGKPALLKRYIVGKVQRDMTEDVLFQLGKEISRLHQLPVPDFVLRRHAFVKIWPDPA